MSRPAHGLPGSNVEYERVNAVIRAHLSAEEVRQFRQAAERKLNARENSECEARYDMAAASREYDAQMVSLRRKEAQAEAAAIGERFRELAAQGRERRKAELSMHAEVGSANRRVAEGAAAAARGELLRKKQAARALTARERADAADERRQDNASRMVSVLEQVALRYSCTIHTGDTTGDTLGDTMGDNAGTLRIRFGILANCSWW